MRIGMEEIRAVQRSAGQRQQGAALPAALATTGTAAVAAGRGAAIPETFSGLPFMDAAIPTSLTLPLASPHCIGLALALLDAGILDDGTAFSAGDDVLALCDAALDQWTKAKCGELTHLTPWVNLDIAQENGDFFYQLAWYAMQAQPFLVGPVLEELESQHPGLGQAVLVVLDTQQSFYLFTPSDLWENASHMYWYGERDESEYLSEANDDEELAQMKEGLVTHANIASIYPPWCAAQTRKVRVTAGSAACSWALIAACAAGGRAGQVAAVVSDMIALMKQYVAPYIMVGGAEDGTDDHFNIRSVVDGQFYGFGALLHWRDLDKDVAGQVYDDVVNYAMQAEGRDHIGLQRIAVSDGAALVRLLNQFADHLHMIGLIDRLLGLLVEQPA